MKMNAYTLLKTTGLLLAVTLAVSACPKREEPAAVESPAAAEEAEEKTDPSVVSLSLESQKLIDLKIDSVRVREVTSRLTTTGEVAANADQEAHVTTRIAGRVTRILVGVGASVRAGQPLAMLESVALGQTQSEFLQAEAKAALARKMQERQRKLFNANLTARKDLQTAENELQVAQIDVERLTNQLKLLGFVAPRIAGLARSRRLDPTVPLLAPIGGVVVTKHLTLGEMLEPNSPDPAFSITDISRLWVNADIQEKDLPVVRAGQAATIETSADPGRRYQGTVSLVSATLDEKSRTAKARIVVNNFDHKLKPEMFATVSIGTGTRSVLAVPKSAIQEEDKQKLVFSPLGEGKFREVRIQVGTEFPDFVQVLAGLKAGDKVVTHGAFDLRAQARKSTFGGEE